MRRRYQEGGEADVGLGDEGGILSLGGGDSGADPTQTLLGILTQQYQTTPEAQEFAKKYLNDLMASGALANNPDSAALGKMKGQAEDVRRALRAARQRLLAENYNPGDALLAASQALGAPTRTGALGETMAAVSGNLREPLAKRREFERNRDTALSQLDVQEAMSGEKANEAELQLEKLQKTLQARMAEEAFKTLGKTPMTNALGNILPKSIEALDRTYAPEYLQFVQGGSAKAAQGLETLGYAAKELRAGHKNISGPLVGTVTSIPYIGRGIQDVVWPQGSDVRALIEQTVQNSLRPILGAQFTQREGENLLARVFNPRLEEWRNARRLDYLREQMTRAYQNQVALAQYYKKHQTLLGFEGQTSYNISDFVPPAHIGAGSDPDHPDAETTDELGDAARRSLGPDATIYKDEAERQEYEQARRDVAARKKGHAKGGRIRMQGGGSPSLYLPEVPKKEDDQSEGVLDKLKDAWNSGALAPDIVMGGLSGTAAEEALAGLYRRLRYGPERHVEEAIRRSGIDPAEAAADIKRSSRAGTPEMLLDIPSAPIQALTERAMTYGGPEADATLDMLRTRNEGMRDRVNERINKGLKPFSYYDQSEKLANRAYDQSKPLFDAAYAKAPGLPQDEVLNAIIDTPEGQKALGWAMRFYNNVPGRTIGKEDVAGLVQKPSLEFYDYVRKGLDQLITREERSGHTEFGDTVLRPLRKTFVDRLDELAPTEYKEARQQYAGDLEVKDALSQGLNFDKMNPDELKALASTQSFHEKNSFRTGMAQRLFDILDKSSSDSFNAAQKIVGSPRTMAQMEPFFDSPGEFKIFQTALEKEADIFRNSRGLVSRGEDLRLKAEKTRQSPMEYTEKTAPGFRFSINPLGWALRLMRDRPKMSAKQAEGVLDVLQRGNPQEMDAFARSVGRMAKFRGTRTGRIAAAAAIGAGAKLLMSGDKPTEEDLAPIP